MLKTYSELSGDPYFTRELFERVEDALYNDGADARNIKYQFHARPDLEGIPYMLYATVEVED